jgi:hypothetical protein
MEFAAAAQMNTCEHKHDELFMTTNANYFTMYGVQLIQHSYFNSGCFMIISVAYEPHLISPE